MITSSPGGLVASPAVAPLAASHPARTTPAMRPAGTRRGRCPGADQVREPIRSQAQINGDREPELGGGRGGEGGRRGVLGEASPPQVEVGRGHAFGGAERDHAVIAGGKPLKALDPAPGGGRSRAGAMSGANRPLLTNPPSVPIPSWST